MRERAFISRLRDLREDADLTQAQVAAVLHMSQTGYSKYETGENDIPTQVLIQLARFYGTSTDYLLGCESKRTVDVSGLTPKEIQTITELVADMTEKNKKLEGL